MAGAMMRLLMILGVLLCSMHLAETASAHAADDGAAFHLMSDTGDGERQAPVDIAHGGHHHCPVAPDLRQPIAMAVPLTREPLFVAIVSPLTSRAPPPLLDPPLA